MDYNEVIEAAVEASRRANPDCGCEFRVRQHVCSYHEGYIDGLDKVLYALERVQFPPVFERVVELLTQEANQ